VRLRRKTSPRTQMIGYYFMGTVMAIATVWFALKASESINPASWANPIITGVMAVFLFAYAELFRRRIKRQQQL